MSKYDFDKVLDRHHSSSYKWDVEDDVISMSIADMDFSVLPEIKEAIKKQADFDIYGYTYTKKEYFEAYQNWFKKYGYHFEVEEALYSTSIVGSIDSIIKRITSDNDKISMLTPTYNVFFNCIRNNHRTLKDIPFIYEEGKYSLDWEKIEEGIKDSKLFIFCNPQNPNGKRFTEEEIKRFASLCEKYDTYLLSDEIHCDVSLGGKDYVPTGKVTDYKNLIVCLSPGKVFNLAGLHSSIVVIKDKELREVVEKGLGEDDIGEPSIFSVDPVIAAYQNGNEYVKELNEYLKENRRLVIEELKSTKCHVVDNEMTYLLWIDISSYKLDSDIFVKRLKEEGRVLLASGKNYGDFRFVRMNIATNRVTIKEAIKRLKNFLGKIDEN